MKVSPKFIEYANLAMGVANTAAVFLPGVALSLRVTSGVLAAINLATMKVVSDQQDKIRELGLKNTFFLADVTGEEVQLVLEHGPWVDFETAQEFYHEWCKEHEKDNRKYRLIYL